MKKIITAFIFCFSIGKCFSQAGEWVWMKGDSILSQLGNFGVQGVPSPTNNPPGLYEPCEWTDLNGNFWLFGGYRAGANMGDLWKYNPVTNEWTWMKGSGGVGDPGSYGTQGIPSVTNNPPSRDYGIASWVDNSGNLWMFGGRDQVNDGLSDLWRYEISTNEWTWIKGPNIISQAGIYGTQGVPDPANNPGARWECGAAWTDDTGDLWLFGGFNIVSFNDLWRFNIASNQWTWMKGSQMPNMTGVYGTLGIENNVNTPGARSIYSNWKSNSGNLWLFAGFKYNTIVFNDLWRYNPTNNNWAWMGGDSVGGASGKYGTKCLASPANMPGARYENRASWTDQNENFWFFGGSIGNSSQQVWNDLWVYCVAADQWTWMKGDSISNPMGIWGTLGVSNPSNKPKGRGGSVGWSDGNGHLYLFGGVATSMGGYYNDLWKYTIDTTCGICATNTDIQENNFTNELLVFPNPTNSSLTVSFQSSTKQNIELRIFNTLGKQIYVEKEETTKGKFEKEINVEKWSNGIYFLQVKTKNGLMNKKIIVSH